MANAIISGFFALSRYSNEERIERVKKALFLIAMYAVARVFDVHELAVFQQSRDLLVLFSEFPLIVGFQNQSGAGGLLKKLAHTGAALGTTIGSVGVIALFG